ncbi:BTB/POZ domain-containing protein At3g19850-like isoform X2 [Solanum pennellii]|uniref:BTB/POZ domain-containing protein At3g19850-like isoform X2 n=1 Tax=Solanum pennellii TaxID=28526 RepID=A0ABM1FMU4_SOLPN|nr:BTB/POZ domain-containing protein At3g19850-like isoform X2 [Solanum pennellii]
MPLQAPCDLQIHVNGQQTFFLHQKVLSRFSGKLRKIIKQEKKKTQIKNSDFLEMTEKLSCCNLLYKAETFFEGLCYWSFHDILKSLKSCETFFDYAISCGLIEKLITSLLGTLFGSSCSSVSSCSSSEQVKPCSWWFEEMTILPPKMIEEFLRTLGAFGSENNSLLLTRFLLYYLKTSSHCQNMISRSEYSGLADTVVHGVVKTTFSCRNLFWVLRIVSGFGISKECRGCLEKLIGGVLDQATLDDILVCGHNNNIGGVYDVNLVMRLVRVFVYHDKVTITKFRKVARLIDKYLREIAPDQTLKISKFLAVAESLPDYARDSFDGVYRAIDIYLESHPVLSLEERSRLCRCLNYEKLSLEACKDLAKNPRISPRIAIKALASQCSSSIPTIEDNNNQMVLYKTNKSDHHSSSVASDQQSLQEEEHEYMRLNLQKMQWRVVELEKVCRDMKGQMTKMVKTGTQTRALPRLCRSQNF